MSSLVSVTVARYRDAGSTGRESRAVKTWAEATLLMREWARDDATVKRMSLWVRPRWSNGLILTETRYTADEAADIKAVGTDLYLHYAAQYGAGRGKRHRSSKAAMARECLARCAFNDTDGEDSSEDARVFDAAKRAIETCFPDRAAQYIDRIRSWMLDGGRVR